MDKPYSTSRRLSRLVTYIIIILKKPNITIIKIYRHFNELYGKAIDSTWYKRAVDQHAIEPDSFVFSVPFDSGYNSGKNSSVLVTAAHAIFIEHRGHKAPAAVVGLQFQHESLSKHFINITSAVIYLTHNIKNYM